MGRVSQTMMRNPMRVAVRVQIVPTQSWKSTIAGFPQCTPASAEAISRRSLAITTATRPTDRPRTACHRRLRSTETVSAVSPMTVRIDEQDVVTAPSRI
jgi:hypothetical protein